MIMDSNSRQGRPLPGRPLKGVSPNGGFDFDAAVSPNVAGALALQRFPVRIRSLSNIGVSFLVEAAADDLIKGHTDLTLTLRLPGKATPSTISCHVRHRSSSGEAYLYGCEYDWSGTLDPLGVAEDLVGYMLDEED